MTDKTGWPAFPVSAELCQDLTVEQQRGMTLRDYFAAKAMQALIIANGPAPQGGWTTYAERTAYLVADAMLKAREQ
jgi:hypothetical protein